MGQHIASLYCPRLLRDSLRLLLQRRFHPSVLEICLRGRRGAAGTGREALDLFYA